MTAYDSQEDDLGHNDQPRKRQKRFAFQRFAQRVAKVGRLGSTLSLLWRCELSSGALCAFNYH